MERKFQDGSVKAGPKTLEMASWSFFRVNLKGNGD